VTVPATPAADTVEPQQPAAAEKTDGDAGPTEQK